MTTKLIQKQLFKGTQEFEIVDDSVNIHIKSPFKQDETLTVMLAVLNPEPIISKSRLEFTSRVNNEALVSLLLAKPNAEEFNAFVNLLKQKAQEEYNEFAGLTAADTKLEGNVYDEPPDFEATDKPAGSVRKPVRVEAVDPLEDGPGIARVVEAEQVANSRRPLAPAHRGQSGCTRLSRSAA